MKLHHFDQKSLIKFLLVLGVFTIYFGYLSWHYGLATGGLVSALTWSFFVLCTPIADAGMLLDFPIRLILGIRMIFTELFVWGTAFLINTFSLTFFSGHYQKTTLTHALYQILTTPYPYWSIIVLCCIGTFLSLYIGDEFYDLIRYRGKSKLNNKTKYIMLLTAFVYAIIVVLYYFLIHSLHISF